MDNGNLGIERLIDACGDGSFEAGLKYEADLEPLAGPGSPVKPAIYAGAVYQHDQRWVRRGDELRNVAAIVVDNVPSQANRLEAALSGSAGDTGLPEITMEFGDLRLPGHLLPSISSFSFPHRNADAYLRDAVLDGVPFTRHPVGEAIFSASALRPEALFEWMPQALLFGFWQSHLGKKRQQTKLARSWVSEILGLEPATTDTKVLGLKGDPYNLSVESGIEYDPDDLLEWSVKDSQRATGRKSKDSLGEIGHGQVPLSGETPAPVAFRALRQTATVSFASLRRIAGPTPEAAAAGRALLVAMGVLAHSKAFGRAFNLRSGADLRPSAGGWTWLGSEDIDLGQISHESAERLWVAAVDAAAAAGLPVGRGVWKPLTIEPGDSLRKVIGESYPDLDET